VNLLPIAIIASLTTVTGYAMAGANGSQGATSSGKVNLNMGKPNVVRITDLDDINLGTASTLKATVSASDDVCVFSSTGGYNITITSANGAFELEDGNTTTKIPYNIDWTAGATSNVVYNTPLNGLIAVSNSVVCSSLTNASFVNCSSLLGMR
jgi:alanine-alpha-ketoisovalerate/valine-pyruvate aminotransferase